MIRALIARADDGGLGTMTWELARHVAFDRILVVHTDHSTRGHARVERYDGLGEVRSIPNGLRARDATWVTKGVDVLYTAETFYSQMVMEFAKAHGTKTVLHAMPEMHAAWEVATEVWAPTHWRTDVLPDDYRWMPVPVDRKRLPPREQDLDRMTLFHVHSTAMADRNGTRLLLDAVRHLDFHTELRIIGGTRSSEMVGRCHVVWLGASARPYYKVWAENARRSDVFVIPRRFGGLSLPMNEAASLGMPIVALDLAPQRTWIPKQLLVDAHVESQAQMKGGTFDVNACRPRALADCLNWLNKTPHMRAFAADASDRYSASISWGHMADEYDEALTHKVDAQ